MTLLIIPNNGATQSAFDCRPSIRLSNITVSSP